MHGNEVQLMCSITGYSSIFALNILLMAKKKASSNIILTELFLVKADWSRTFWGAIRRVKEVDGNEIVLGSAIVNEGRIWSKAFNQQELMKNMDDLCIMKLDYRLHTNQGVTTFINNLNFYHN
jgi:hypothetical protein